MFLIATRHARHPYGWSGRLLLVSLLLLALAIPAWAAKQTVIPVLTCPFGCGGVAAEAQLAAQLARDESPVLVAGQETPGLVYNLRVLARDKRRWKTNTILSSDFLLGIASHGGQSIVKNAFPEPVETHNQYKLLFSILYDETGKFFLTFNPDIKTIADLKGETIGLGLYKQSEFGLLPTLLLKQYGVTPTNTSIRRAPPAALVGQLLNGSVDAIVTNLNTDAGTGEQKQWPIVGALQQLVSSAQSAGRKLYYIGVDKAHLDALNKQWGLSLFPDRLPAHSLPMQDQPITVGAGHTLTAAHISFSDDLAYQYVTAVAKAAKKLHKTAGGVWSLWSPEMMVSGLTDDNVQPGAKKAYKELGWWKLRKQTPPVHF